MYADIKTLIPNCGAGSTQAAIHSISELIRRFSTSELRLNGAALGVAIHHCEFPDGRYAVGVIDGDAAWIVPTTPRTHQDIAREVRDACYEEAERAQVLNWQRAA